MRRLQRLVEAADRSGIEQLMDTGAPEVGVNQHDTPEIGFAERHGEIEGRKRLPFPCHGTGNHHFLDAAFDLELM